MRVKIVLVDRAEEDENGNGKAPERTVVLLDPCLHRVLPPRPSLVHILQRHPIRLLPLTIPENAGESEDPNAVADDRTVGLRHATNTRKMDFRRINGQFLSLNWS